MSDIAIRAEGVGKLYRLGQIGTGTISHDLNRWFAKMRGKDDPFAKIGETNDRTKKGDSEYVWALKDVNFEIKKGEAVGIIGRNGAGKSTLLKLLSKVTKPTTGNIKINGRIASLLEVGTGFHPEMTGRENIYLNGAILGMTKKEITRKFDEIVDFSGVERYIDTPVKRYSSGMYVRLAFGVAAHLESEILIVDEVLAVGDAEFQKKCLGKMEDISKGEGRTVLFVSHNMGSIKQLCTLGLLLSNGRIFGVGPVNKTINDYLNQNGTQAKTIEKSEINSGNGFSLIYLIDKHLQPKVDFSFDEEISIRLKMILPEFTPSLEVAIRLIDKNKNAVFTIHEKLSDYLNNDSIVEIIISIPPKFLTPGRYSFTMCINHPGVRLYDLREDILPFTIIDTGSDFSRYEGIDYGNVFAKYLVKDINNEKIG